MKRPARGFTLVEVLVVLVIGSLVTALLFQMLAQTYKLRGRFGEALSASQAGRMRADWVRLTLRGLEATLADAPTRFQGREQRLDGITNAPITQGGSALRPFSLEWVRSDREWALRYADGAQPWTLWSASLDATPRLRYVDDEGREHAQWPPSTAAPARRVPGNFRTPEAGVGVWRQLPAAVLITWRDLQGQQQVLVAAMQGGRDAQRPVLDWTRAP